MPVSQPVHYKIPHALNLFRLRFQHQKQEIRLQPVNTTVPNEAPAVVDFGFELVVRASTRG
jgi:hypothetical protein